jgi:hypothetical protein
MTSFVCSTCGNTHEGLPTDFGWPLPDEVWAIPEAERPTRAKFDSDRCQLGERFFIRCVLALPFTEQPGHFAWGVWAEILPSDFWRYIELYEKDGRAEPTITGSIANAIPGYNSTVGLAVQVQLQDERSRPSLRVVDVGHPLSVEQLAGISNHRYHDILASTGVSRARPD